MSSLYPAYFSPFLGLLKLELPTPRDVDALSWRGYLSQASSETVSRRLAATEPHSALNADLANRETLSPIRVSKHTARAVGVTGHSNHSPSTLASLSGALVVLVWREVAGQSRFRHDQTGDRDLGRTLSKSGAGSEDRRGSGQYVSPWTMTVWSSLSSRIMLDCPCSPLCGAWGVPIPIGRLRSTSHCG